MRVRFAPDSRCVYGQLIVEAQNQDERILLNVFSAGVRDQSFIPWLHGHTRRSELDGVTDLNFGWLKREPSPTDPTQQREPTVRHLSQESENFVRKFITEMAVPGPKYPAPWHEFLEEFDRMKAELDRMRGGRIGPDLDPLEFVGEKQR